MNGTIIDNIPASDRIEYQGWIVYDGGYEDELIIPTNKEPLKLDSSHLIQIKVK